MDGRWPGARVATLLLIDDSDAQRAEVRRALEAAGLFERILEAANGVDGLKLLLAEPVDVVLSDVEMPGLDGEKLLQIKESRGDVRDTPILFLTASAELDRRVRLIEQGASDTLSKPFHPSELVARLRLHLKLKRLQDELKVKNEALSRLSTTDSLTGLRNRRYADEVLAIEVLRARRYRTPLSLLLADIDLFKRVNDEHGHAAGDTVLRRVAETLRDNLRATDVAARYGGEEFLVIMAHNDLSGAVRLAERWRGAVEHDTVRLSEGKDLRVTISVGVTAFAPSIATAPDLVAEADTALYAAKQAGRNRVEVRKPHP
jgi:diguanylate cyclase (GGDEF)-like protein